MTKVGLEGERPTVRSIVETYGPLFQLIISYSLPYTPFRHLFKPAIDAKVAKNQVPAFKGLIKIKSPVKDWDQPIGQDDPLEVEIALGVARALYILEAPIRDISSINFYDDKVVITVRGVMGLSRLQGRFFSFLREKIPQLNIPYGGDSEALFRPEILGFQA